MPSWPEAIPAIGRIGRVINRYFSGRARELIVSTLAQESDHVRQPVAHRHNITLSMFMTLQVLSMPVAAIASAIYSRVMYATASLFAVWLLRTARIAAPTPAGEMPAVSPLQHRSLPMPFTTRLCAVLAACLWMFLLPSLVAAQSPEPLSGRIGFVDIQKILATSKAGRMLTADIERQRNVAESRLKAMQPPMTDLRTRIVEGSSTLSEEQLTQLKRELEDKMAEMSRAQDDATRDIKKASESGLEAIEQRVMPAINQIGKEGGYSFIFRKYESGLIYADEAGDITELVIQRMDSAE